jgi:hypothetical protein
MSCRRKEISKQWQSNFFFSFDSESDAGATIFVRDNFQSNNINFHLQFSLPDSPNHHVDELSKDDEQRAYASMASHGNFTAFARKQ